jgi:hypothetical protein
VIRSVDALVNLEGMEAAKLRMELCRRLVETVDIGRRAENARGERFDKELSEATQLRFATSA